MKYLDNDILCAVGDSVVGRTRAANEDNCGYGNTPNGFLFVVCDGMGGHVGGAVASKIAVDSILDFLGRSMYDDIPAAIRNAMEYANIQILGKAKENPELSGMGTTACVLLLENGNAWIAHVGDSRIYLFSKETRSLHRITKDHSFVQGLVDSGQLDDRDAETHPRKNVILRALGLKPDVSVEVAAFPVRPAKDDVFMICSDGLSGMLDDDAIEQILNEDYDIDDTLSVLMNDANEPGKGKDNITAQLIRIKESQNQKSSFPDYNPKWRKVKTGNNEQRRIQTGEYTPSAGVLSYKYTYKYMRYAVGIGVVFIIAVALIVILSLNKDENRVEENSYVEWVNAVKDKERTVSSLKSDIKRLNESIEEMSQNKDDETIREQLDLYEKRLDTLKNNLKVEQKALKDLNDSQPDKKRKEPERVKKSHQGIFDFKVRKMRKDKKNTETQNQVSV